MKVAIPTNDGISIISNLNNIKGFKIYEIDNGAILQERFVKKPNTNSYDMNYDYPVHPKKDEDLINPLMQAIVDCKVVISNGISKKFFEELVQAQKEVYITETNDVRSAIRNFLKRQKNLKSDLFNTI